MTNQQFLKIVLLVLFTFFLWSQTLSDKSLLPYDTIDNNYFKDQGDAKRQLAWAKVYLDKAKKENKAIRKARGYYLYAILYYEDQPLKAIQYLDSVIKYSKIEPNKFFPAAAFCEKAGLLVDLRKFDEALLNFNLAEQVALKTNIDYYYMVRDYIGTTKSEEMGEVEEALQLYHENYKYYKTKDYRGDYYSYYYQNTIFGLADCHKSLKHSDSTTFYNKLGYKETTITKNNELQLMFTLNEGANQVDKRNFRAALDSINKALPGLIKVKNTGNVLASYFYLGKSYAGLGDKLLAVQNFIKVDSMYRVRKKITPEFVGGYSYLIEYYKQTGDKQNQLKYLTTYMEIDSVLQKNYKHLSKVLRDEYDTPHLMAEKEALIQLMEKKQSASYIWIVVLVVGVAGLIVYQFYLKKQHQNRFEAILNPAKSIEENSTVLETQLTTPDAKKSQVQQSLSNEIVLELLEKLTVFENDKGFIENTISIQKLALELNTNTKYLSKVINEQKGKTFVQYINELRVNEAVLQLQAQPILQNYTIASLASEFGFNSAEAFSAAFYKKYKIKPSFFIKELSKTRAS
ncbi:AraC-like DNA-binding protein [Flavobacterium tiangeerense]|uniref:AraC-like DNA-binding protein n=1 Tax=Flavobacterium tiangeerense TaxID=459471 RepID=A0ABY3FLP1_9FLAO|nr:helix-turn-helix domain-containing protein [Flavobacterium tiangeerense]TWI01229.1 AraC-like DNA-binding protein [Flavobacterium tiangeerense]